MTATHAEQIMWQKQAHKVLSAFLDRAWREGLPPLQWTIGDTGVTLTGRAGSYAAGRRAAITAWADALGITLTPLPREGGVEIFGTAGELSTPQGQASVTLAAYIWEESTDGN